ncbi:hypothetical protein CPB84DRAFT_1625991, partial [Gymnopilus junonius]
ENRKPLSICKIFTLYNVRQTTLQDHLNGAQSQKDAHAHECKLSNAEEDILADWTKTLGHCGLPVTLDMLGEHASVRKSAKVGANWPHKFMERHPELKIK